MLFRNSVRKITKRGIKKPRSDRGFVNVIIVGCLIPLQFCIVVHGAIDAFHFMLPVKLIEIHFRHQFRLYMIDRVIERFHELIEILFIQKDFVLFVDEALILESPFALGNGEIVVVRSGSFDIEKVSSFASTYPFRVYFVPASLLIVFHGVRLVVDRI